jgi:hypothetical protein
VVASLVGLVALTLAAPAAAEPTEPPPRITVSGSGYAKTESVLYTQGFVTPKVFYRIGGSQDVLVVYDGGGPADPLEAMRQIEGTVWGLEPFRFDRLVIQNGSQAPFVATYEELQAGIGPRAPGLDAIPLRNVPALGAAAGTAVVFVEFVDLFKVIVAVIGATALLAVLAFGLASYVGSRGRGRGRDERSDRLFA